jgi:hypothetical protein
VQSEHEKSYAETHGYMTGKTVSYLQSNGSQKEFWSREISGSGQKVEDPSQKLEGDQVSIVLSVDWHRDCPDEVKGKMAKRRVVALSDSDDEDLKEKVTVGHMSVRDSKVTEANEEFGFLRETVIQYVAACNIRSQRAQNLVESLSDEKNALVRAFTQGREVKRKYEEVRRYEDEFNLEPQRFVSEWAKEDVMGALADVKGYLEEREDLREAMMLSPLNHQSGVGAINFTIDQVIGLKDDVIQVKEEENKRRRKKEKKEKKVMKDQVKEEQGEGQEAGGSDRTAGARSEHVSEDDRNDEGRPGSMGSDGKESEETEEEESDTDLPHGGVGSRVTGDDEDYTMAEKLFRVRFFSNKSELTYEKVSIIERWIHESRRAGCYLSVDTLYVTGFIGRSSHSSLGLKMQSGEVEAALDAVKDETTEAIQVIGTRDHGDATGVMFVKLFSPWDAGRMMLKVSDVKFRGHQIKAEFAEKDFPMESMHQVKQGMRGQNRVMLQRDIQRAGPSQGRSCLVMMS